VADSGDQVKVEVSQDRRAALGLAPGIRVFVTSRQVKIFVEDYSIYWPFAGSERTGGLRWNAS